jgi:pimeloyl-ACP methyl ester carboxylesterase
MVKARDAEGRSMQQPFAALPGLKVKQTAQPALRYFSYGTGPDALLIVNAFGLSLDFWQVLAGSLQDRFTLFALDKRDAADDETCISRTYYSADNYADDYVADVAEVLRSAGIDRCHVVSWCSGAKLAIELADAIPGSIRSLSLIAPSFAGIESPQGCDSAYEKNLHTMCRIVRQMPKSAGNMASSMTAIMHKSSNDLDRFHRNAKDAVDVFELPDAHHLPLLYRPFSSAQNMVAFSQQLMHFRAHDITPRLGKQTLQVPVMLVTGRTDTTTSASRAKDICGRLPHIVGFEIEGSSHYLIHQNYRIVADLLRAFATDGMDMAYSNPRVERSVFQQMEETVTGEI